MVSNMFSTFSLQVTEELSLEVWNFCVFSELVILEWFLTWHFKHFLYLLIFKGARIL